MSLIESEQSIVLASQKGKIFQEGEFRYTIIDGNKILIPAFTGTLDSLKSKIDSWKKVMEVMKKFNDFYDAYQEVLFIAIEEKGYIVKDRVIPHLIRKKKIMTEEDVQDKVINIINGELYLPDTLVMEISGKPL